jgi:hypothetical protein
MRCFSIAARCCPTAQQPDFRLRQAARGVEKQIGSPLPAVWNGSEPPPPVDLAFAGGNSGRVNG